MSEKNPTEEWRAVPGYEGWYEASSYGRIRSMPRWGKYLRCGKPAKRFYKGKVLSLKPKITGYTRSCLQKNGKSLQLDNHRIVALAFIGPNPNGLDVDHIDGNKSNNRPSNLEYVTSEENTRRAYALGLMNNTGVHNGRSKLTDRDVLKIRKTYRRGITRQVDLASRFGVTQTIISLIIRNELWNHVA